MSIINGSGILFLHGEQIRAARSLLGWSQSELAKKAGVAHMTVRRFEAKNGPVGGTIASLTRVQQTLEQAGIHFIPADDWGSVGVRFSPPKKKEPRAGSTPTAGVLKKR
jgi:transcriptional regulator with XRE-family HTH domain